MKRYIAGVCTLIGGLLACRPVLAIGGGEFLILVVLFVLLVGPPAYRFLRRLERSRERKKR